MQLNKSLLEKQINKATEYLNDRKNNKAENYLDKIIKKDPANDEAWLLLGIAKRRLDKKEEAIECFTAVTELNVSKEEAWGLLTITLVDQGNIDMAKKTIEKAGRLNPDNSRIQFLRHTLIETYIKYGPFF